MLNKILLSVILLLASIGGASNAIASTPLNNHLESIKETFVPSGEAKLFCRVTGQGKPLIVIHGGPGSGQDYFLPHMYDLAKNNFVIFYDQRGAGRSPGEINEDTMAISAFVEDLEVLRKAFNFDKISILGHSWGAFVAMHYAIEHPKCIDRLILSNPCPASSDDFSIFEKERDKRLSNFQGELSKIQNSQEYQNGDPELHERLLKIFVRTYCHVPESAESLNLHLNRDVVINAIKIHQIVSKNILEKPFDLHDRLKKLQIPTLVIHGDDDPIPLSSAQHIHENILGSKLVVLDDCGHYPYVEQAELYFQSLNEFLK